MNKLFQIILVFALLPLVSCSSDDDSSNESNYPQTVNIKYEVTTSRNTSAIITTTLDNNTESNTADSLPFSDTYAQTEVNIGTYVKITYLENGIYAVGPNGSNWTDYEAELKIYVNNEVVKSQTIEITENNVGVEMIDYTFE